MNVKIKKRNLGKTTWMKSYIDRQAMTAGLARRREDPSLGSLVRVSTKNGYSDRIPISDIHDENKRPISADLLQQAISKRQMIAERRN